MNAGNHRFKLNWSSLWHLWKGGTRLVFAEGISILRVVLLLDVSKWQGVIDFLKMKAAGVHGVIIKCGQGVLQDPKFTNNWSKAKLAGIPRGSYWFYDSRVDPRVQAGLWWDWIKSDRGGLMYFADYEENYFGPWRGHKYFKIFLQEFQRLSGFPSSKIGIYTGYYYWIANSPTTLAELNWFSQFDLWLAWYTTNPANVIIPKPWTKLILWQYGTVGPDGTPNGEKYGAESIEIDENNFNGDEQAYKERFSLSGDVILPAPPPVIEPVPPPASIPPEPQAQLWNATVIVNGLHVRSYPVVIDGTKIKTGDKFVQVNSWDKFTGRLWVGNSYVWMLIDTATRPEIVGHWVAVRTENGLSKFITLMGTGIAPAPVHAFTVPAVGEFLITRHDYQRADWNNKPRSFALNFKRNPPECALPETVPLPGNKPNDFVPLSKDWQIFWFVLMNHASAGSKSSDELLAAWEDLTVQGRGFTDFHSVAYGFTDYILGKNLGIAKGPMQHKSLSCGGNIVRKIGVHSSGKYIIEALDLSKPPPDPFATIKKNWLVHWATQETVIPLPGGTWRVSRFPQLAPYGTPFLVVSLNGTNLIERAMVEPIENGATYSPYIQ